MYQNKKLQVVSPFCKVCKDAGKSPDLYYSHFPASKGKNNILCPTLLSQECRYCHEKGHTPKYCPILKAKEEKKIPFEKREQKTLLVKQPVLQMEHVYTSKNVFEVLDSEDSEDNEEVQIDYNSQSESEKIKFSESWASIVMKSPEKSSDIIEKNDIQIASLPSAVSLIRKELQRKPMKRWADICYESSDDEDEEY